MMIVEGEWHEVANEQLAPPRGTLLISPPDDEPYYWDDLPFHYAIRAGNLYSPEVCACMLELTNAYFATLPQVHIKHKVGAGDRSATQHPSLHLLGWKKSAKAPFITKETWAQKDSVRLALKHMLEYFKEHISKPLLGVIRAHDPNLYVKLRL